MLKVYGSPLCKDCTDCLAAFDKAGVSYEFLDITAQLCHMKAFLSLRDSSALFDSVRQAGIIGIPWIVEEEGKVSLSWEGYVSQANA